MTDRIVYTDLDFLMEDPGRGLVLDESLFPEPGVTMSGDFGLANDGSQGEEEGHGNAMDGLDSDGLPYFNDRPDGHPDGSDSQVDQMAGVVNDAHVETLANDQMQAMARPLPFPPVPETAEPIIEGMGKE